MSLHKQKGMVLVVSLLLLLMLTLIAISAANQSGLQLRIASNSEQQNAAFQAAESGLALWTDEYFNASDNAAFPDDWTSQQIGSLQENRGTLFPTQCIPLWFCCKGGFYGSVHMAHISFIIKTKIMLMILWRLQSYFFGSCNGFSTDYHWDFCFLVPEFPVHGDQVFDVGRAGFVCFHGFVLRIRHLRNCF